LTIGILALQGDVREHTSALADVGESARPVRVGDDLEGLSGIVLPGGESTTLSLLLEASGLADPLAEVLGDGLPAFGTCAGMILLSRGVIDGRADQRSFAAIDLSVRRNGYGRQAASFECDVAVDRLGEVPVHAVFIRAPVVEAVGPEVEVLATLPSGSGPDAPEGASRIPGPGRPVVCRQGRVLVAAFHPELTGDRRLHELFVSMTKEER
jgi:5'-phosphate synthase pdxT subunit